MRQFLEDGEFILVYSTVKAKGGPFTRYDIADPENKHKMSCLDLFIVSRNLYKYVEVLEVDSKLQMTPFYVKCKNGEKNFTDHYACLMTFKGIPLITHMIKAKRFNKLNGTQVRKKVG